MITRKQKTRRLNKQVRQILKDRIFALFADQNPLTFRRMELEIKLELAPVSEKEKYRAELDEIDALNRELDELMGDRARKESAMLNLLADICPIQPAPRVFEPVNDSSVEPDENETTEAKEINFAGLLEAMQIGTEGTGN